MGHSVCINRRSFQIVFNKCWSFASCTLDRGLSELGLNQLQSTKMKTFIAVAALAVVVRII